MPPFGISLAGHGPMFNASFHSALLDMSREKASNQHSCP